MNMGEVDGGINIYVISRHISPLSTKDGSSTNLLNKLVPGIIMSIYTTALSITIYVIRFFIA